MTTVTDDETEVRRAKRSWPAQYKLDILNEIEAAKDSGSHPRELPSWRLAAGAAGLTIHPSVDYRDERRCPYWVRDGRVQWM